MPSDDYGPNRDEEFALDRRHADRRIDRVEEKVTALGKMEAVVAAQQSSLDRMESDIHELIEAKTNYLLIVREIEDMKHKVEEDRKERREDSKEIKGRIAVLEKIAYAMLGVYVFLQVAPALQALVAGA